MTSTPPEDPPTPPGEPDPAASTTETGAIPPAHAPLPAGPSFDQTAAFAPVPRAPRVPWVNPDRRSHVVGASVIGGLVVLAAGFGIGYASSSDHDRGGPRMERIGGPYFQGPPGQLRPAIPRGQFPGNGNGRRVRPGGGQPAPTSVPATPPTEPTPTKTG